MVGPQVGTRPREVFLRAAHQQDIAGAGGEHPAIGGYHVGGNQVVATQAVAAGKPSDAAAQGETGNAGIHIRPSRRGEAESLGLVVECPPLGPALRPNSPGHRVNANAGHAGKVNHQPIVADAVSREVVAAAPH